VSTLAWFFLILVMFGLFMASGRAHRVDLPFLAAILAFGLILGVSIARHLVGRLGRRGD
jgi:hypothetical protein